jgi:hypothetical protein
MSERYFDPRKITGGEQCLVGSFTGEVGSYNATEPHKGTLIMDGNHDDSAMAKECLTARPTSRAGTKVGHSDPVMHSGMHTA